MDQFGKKKKRKSHQGARSLALTILLKIHRQHVRADELIEDFLGDSQINKLDRGFIFELVYGVLRHRETLDWRLNVISDRPMSRLPLTIAMIFRLGAYQLLYLDKIPSSAAVNESVKLSKTVGGRNWSGVMNAVLRNLLSQPTPPWPDPQQDPIGALSIPYSCPSWLVQRWLDTWGFTRTEQLCQATLRIPPVTLRTNTVRCTRSDLLHRLRTEGYDCRETLVSPVGIVLEKCGNLSDLAPLQEGWCYIEDEAAQLIPLILDVKSHHEVLDVCAAPGGKTTHIAQLMQNQGCIVALDRNSQRLGVLATNYQRLGLTNISSHCADITSDELDFSPTTTQAQSEHKTISSRQSFDRILVDAPCSGLGILRRHPEGKWMKEADLIDQSQLLQREILESASQLLRPGGVLVYSACSTEPEETSHVISEFLDHHQEFHQESVRPWLPDLAQSLIYQERYLLTSFNSFSMDGFFAARLLKP